MIVITISDLGSKQLKCQVCETVMTNIHITGDDNSHAVICWNCLTSTVPDDVHECD